jgi:hypothetical protein
MALELFSFVLQLVAVSWSILNFLEEGEMKALGKVNEGLIFFAKMVGATLFLLVPPMVAASVALGLTYEGTYRLLGGFQLSAETRDTVAAIVGMGPFAITLFMMLFVMGELLCRLGRKERCTC